MSIIDTIGSVSKGVTDKTKSMSEMSNLKNKILYEQERIYEIFQDIGRMYYKNPNEDPEKFQLLCDDVDQRLARIRKMEFELNGIKGRRVCPNCQIEIPEGNLFCGRCGSKVPETPEGE